MLDIAFIRDNAAAVKKAAKDKGLEPALVDKVLEADKKRRELIGKVDELRQEKNQLTEKDRDKGKKIKA